MGQTNSDETVVSVQEPGEGGDKKGRAKVRTRDVTDAVMIRIEVIESNDKVALVEWIEDETHHRGVVPASSLLEGSVALEELHRALPYGEDWESMMVLHTSPAAVAEQLHRSGIWTKHDLMYNIRQAQIAWNSIHAADLGAFIQKTLS